MDNLKSDLYLFCCGRRLVKTNTINRAKIKNYNPSKYNKIKNCGRCQENVIHKTTQIVKVFNTFLVFCSLHCYHKWIDTNYP